MQKLLLPKALNGEPEPVSLQLRRQLQPWRRQQLLLEPTETMQFLHGILEVLLLFTFFLSSSRFSFLALAAAARTWREVSRVDVLVLGAL